MRLERRKALLLSAAAVIAILAILALTLARKVAHLSGNPARPDVPRFQYVGQALRQADYEALGSKPGWRLSVIDRGGGMVLRGLERRAANPASPWILFFEGNSAHLLEEAQRFLDALVDGRDWSAATWAYRGYDGSGGRPDFASLVSDGWQEYEGLMPEERIDRSRIHLVGFSLGPSVAVAIAARAGVH